MSFPGPVLKAPIGKPAARGPVFNLTVAIAHIETAMGALDRETADRIERAAQICRTVLGELTETAVVWDGKKGD